MELRYRLVFLCMLGGCLSVGAQTQEVTIGAQVWSYDRVYPLLDGLLQDAASTQLQQLVLDPNKTNASQLDALIQAFQVQAGFSQLAGVQNTVSSQMALANLGYQATQAQQQQSILQQSIAAQQALTKANQDLLTANQSGNQTQIGAANLEVQTAQALVNGLNAQAALAKGSGTPWSPSSFSGTIATTPTPFTTGVPSSVVTTGANNAGPSFPATKQLDNQMDLLWSRLARVVGAMTRPDSIGSDSRMYMIEFETATFPTKHRKGKVLETRYALSCGEVIDLFPRVAAVNVANTKYRDNADVFGVLLSWFSFGINTTYNREHLKMSQTLGQSSYITGYGVDQNSFGWRFGIPLGDNFVSSDTKRTFALISAPQNCTNPSLTLQNVVWEKPDGSHQENISSVKLDNSAAVNESMAGLSNESSPNSLSAGSGTSTHGPQSSSEPSPTSTESSPKSPMTGRSSSGGRPVTSVEFNRSMYDPSKYSPSTPILVAISIGLSQPIDQQATLYANGILLKRVRDTFVRAIPNGAGSGGLLEESISISQANTWIPISPKHLLVTLDAGQFGSHFPTIQIMSPSQLGLIQVSDILTPGTRATISGQVYECFSKPTDISQARTSCLLPSLAYPSPTSTKVGVFLWETNCAPDPTKPIGCAYQLVLQAPSASSFAASPSSSAVQVVSGAASNPWGSTAEVYLQAPRLNAKQYRLTCAPGESATPNGGNLVCQFWDYEKSDDFNNYQEQDIQLQVIDQGHAGGVLVASTTLPGRAWGVEHPNPRLWSTSNPQWYDDTNGGHWEFQVQFANVGKDNLLSVTPSLNPKGAP